MISTARTKFIKSIALIPKIGLIAVIASSVVAGTFIQPQPVSAGTATKSIVESGPYAPGQEVTINLDFTEPNVAVTPSVEMVVVVDTSGSMSAAIADMKGKLINFIDNALINYPGAVRMGITKIGNGTASFDSNNSNNPVENTPMFYNGTSYALPNNMVGIDKVATITASNIAEFKSAVNAIQIEPVPNPNSPDTVNSYTSDLGPGLGRANGMFTSDPNMSRFVVMLTDGFATKGYCPVNGSGVPAVNFPSGTQLQILPGGSGWTNNNYVATEYRTADPNFPLNYPYNYGEPGVCAPFIFYTGQQRAQNVTQNMANAYGGIQSTNIVTTTLDKVIESAKLSTITIQDTLNGSVFNGITSWVGLYDCSSGTPGTRYTGNTWTVSGNTGTLIVPSSIVNALTRYCVRFKAVLRNDAPSGSQSINTSGNTVVYKNSKGATLATDSISQGSLEVRANTDFAAVLLRTTGSASDALKSVFNVGEPIYLYSRISNNNSYQHPPGMSTQYFKNRTSVAAGVTSDIPMHTTFTDPMWPATYTFSSRPGGTNNAWMIPTKSFTMPAGNYSALMNVNYLQDSGPFPEGDYRNNQLTTNYSVITPPSSLNYSNLKCNSIDLSWTAGSSNITGYDVAITDMVAMTQSIIDGTPYNDYVTYNHSVPASPTNMTASNLKGSTLYSWTLTPKTVNGSGSPVSISFTTPACPTYAVDLGGPYAAEPGEIQVIDVNISYAPDVTTWNYYGARLDVRVVGINYNNESCSAYSPTSSPYFSAVDGFSVRSSSNPSLASYSIGPSSHPYQVKFTASTTTSTDTGRYTICIGYFSPDSYIPHQGVEPVHINVERHPWIQIDKPDNITTSMTGDTHSNAAIDLGVPVNQYFFRDGTAGVVSAYGTGSSNISFAANRTINTTNANLTNKLWRIPSYTERIKTEAYSNLEALAVASLPNPATGLPSAMPSNANINGHCANGSKAYKYTPATGDVLINNAIDLSSKPCANTSLIYFVDGNLRVNANIVDGTTTTTLTFIVKGDVIVNPSVTQMDGVYIFGGSFRDGSSYNTEAGTKDQPLVVHGSLIGLATQSPVSTKGTFSQSTYSGLQRNLSYGPSGNDNVAAERIVYQPKYLFLLRNLLGASSFTWSE